MINFVQTLIGQAVKKFRMCFGRNQSYIIVDKVTAQINFKSSSTCLALVRDQTQSHMQLQWLRFQKEFD